MLELSQPAFVWVHVVFVPVYQDGEQAIKDIGRAQGQVPDLHFKGMPLPALEHRSEQVQIQVAALTGVQVAVDDVVLDKELERAEQTADPTDVERVLEEAIRMEDLTYVNG